MPYILIALLVSNMLTAGASYYYGGKHKKESIEAEQLRAVEKTIELANVQIDKDQEIATESEQAKEVIRTVYIKVRDKANENIEKNSAYNECGLDDVGLQLFNDSASNQKSGTSESAHRMPGPSEG